MRNWFAMSASNIDCNLATFSAKKGSGESVQTLTVSPGEGQIENIKQEIHSCSKVTREKNSKPSLCEVKSDKGDADAKVLHGMADVTDDTVCKNVSPSIELEKYQRIKHNKLPKMTFVSKNSNLIDNEISHILQDTEDGVTGSNTIANSSDNLPNNAKAHSCKRETCKNDIDVLEDLNTLEDPKDASDYSDNRNDSASVDNSIFKNDIYQRFLFNTRRQNVGETLEAFADSLKILSKSCNYDADEELINSLIRDRFIAGIREAQIQSEIIRPSSHGDLFGTVEFKAISENGCKEFSLTDTIKLACVIKQYLQVINSSLKVEPEPTKERLHVVASPQKVTDCNGEQRLNKKNNMTKVQNCINENKNKAVVMDVDNIISNTGKAQNIPCLIEANNIKIDPNEMNPSTDLNKSDKRKKNTSMYHCNYCSEIFPSKKFLAVHKKELHANEERVKCDDCGKVFKDKIRLQKHSDSSHKQNKIICKLCMNCYKSQACLKAHVRGKHEMNGEKVCLVCFQVMADDKELKVGNVYYQEIFIL